MNTIQLLTESYITFGIMLSYAIAIIIGIIIGERQTERTQTNDKQIQSKKEIIEHGTKFTFMEPWNKT